MVCWHAVFHTLGSKYAFHEDIVACRLPYARVQVCISWHAVFHTPFHEHIAGLVACRLTYAILVYCVAISECPGARGVSARCAVGHSHRMMPAIRDGAISV